MKIAETTTAEGSGFWGYSVYEIELRTRFTTYADSAGKITRTVKAYHLRFNCSSNSDFRTFPSESSRAEFIEKNFTQLKMREIPLNEQQSNPLPSPLSDVAGEYLSDVTFVMDYLQVRFCGPSFTFYNWPEVGIDDRKVKFEDFGYRDVLCSLIGKTVRTVDVYLDTGLTFEFDRGEIMAVSLRVPAGSSLPEVAEYSSGNKSGVIWGAGEEPFE